MCGKHSLSSYLNDVLHNSVECSIWCSFCCILLINLILILVLMKIIALLILVFLGMSFKPGHLLWKVFRLVSLWFSLSSRQDVVNNMLSTIDEVITYIEHDL